MRESYYQKYYEVEVRHWWFKVRREMVQHLLKVESERLKDKKLNILDVGCGTGALLGELKDKYSVTGIDFSDKAVAFCRARGIQNVILGVGEKLPFNDNQFDVVMVLDVLEHIEEDKKAIA